jgi:hypothetical protein
VSAIAKEMAKAVYKYARQIVEDRISRIGAIDAVVLESGMGKSSAQRYVESLLKIFEGARYTSTVNQIATRIFFESILRDNGAEGLKDAIQATRLHIDYYENKRNITLRGIISLCDEFEERIIAGSETGSSNIDESERIFNVAWASLINEVRVSGDKMEFKRATGTSFKASYNGDDCLIIKWSSPLDAKNSLLKNTTLQQWQSKIARPALSGGSQAVYDARKAVIDELVKNHSLPLSHDKLNEIVENEKL